MVSVSVREDEGRLFHTDGPKAGARTNSGKPSMSLMLMLNVIVNQLNDNQNTIINSVMTE